MSSSLSESRPEPYREQSWIPPEDIRLSPKNITRSLDILRDMKSLKSIGIDWKLSWPAAEFWARYDQGKFK